MKKILFSITLLVASVATAFAANTARVKIALGVAEVTVRESADYSDAYDNGFDAPAYNAGGIVVSASLNSQNRWAQWATNDIEGVKLAFTPTANDVTFTFSSVIGTVYLRDNANHTSTLIVSGNTYNFTVEDAEVGVENTTRFYLTKLAPPAAYQICYQYGAFEIANPDADARAINIYALGADGQPDTSNALYTGSAEAAAVTTISAADLATAGLVADTQYAIVVGAESALIFRVK